MSKAIGYAVDIQDDEVTITESTGESVTSGELGKLLHFLLEPYEEKYPVLKVVWDLDEFVAPLLRLAGTEACQSLASEKRQAWLARERINLFYIPERIFSINHGRYRSVIYGLSQYAPEVMLAPPITADDVVALARTLLDTLRKMGIPHPRTLTSPVAIYRDEVLRAYSMPKAEDFKTEIQREVARVAFECRGRAWTEAHKLGHFEKVWDYDLTSAYPYIASQMTDWRVAEFWTSDKLEQADYGFLKGKVTIHPDVKVSPIIYEAENGDLSCPTGSWQTTLTLAEVNFIHKWGIGKFEIEKGYYVKQLAKAPGHPLQIPIERLFNKRQATQDKLEQYLLKRVAVGLYGITLHVRDDGKPGEFFNPIWGTYIATLTRLKVAEFIYRYQLQDNLIHVGTDGVLLDKPVDLEKNGEARMGHWRLDYTGLALVASSGRLWYGNKHPAGLYYDRVMTLINTEPDKAYYQTLLPRLTTLGDCVNTGRWYEIGIPMLWNTAIDLVVQTHDREFEQLPQRGKELLTKVYYSIPHQITKRSNEDATNNQGSSTAVGAVHKDHPQ